VLGLGDVALGITHDDLVAVSLEPQATATVLPSASG
jgi:hypothetical protein